MVQKVLALAFGLATAVGAFAQGDSKLHYSILVSGRVLGEFSGTPVKDALVVLRKDGMYDRVVEPGGDGRYVFVADRGASYLLVFSAPDCVPKRVAIDTHGAPPLLDVPELAMTVDITLFPRLEGLATGLFDQPLGKARYKHSVRNMVWDRDYGEQKRVEIKRFMYAYDKKLHGGFTTSRP